MSRRQFSLFNTLTRSVEPITLTEEGHLRMYSCGPTVYTTAHIGNFRSFLTADLIIRTARAIGWRTSYVSNITDVGHLTEDDVADASGEDKMSRALKSKEGEQFANIYDLARHYTSLLVSDWKALNLHEPDVRPRATEHITDQIEAVESLIDTGHAYVTDKGVYFSVGSFDNYGQLSGNKAAENLEHLVRNVVVDDDKRDPRDFALWKRDEKHLMQWYSPFGRGFPGWHIECSVMAMRYLGETIDIHAGGEDLIFPHHECEIAQSESLTGKPFATHWVHTRFLQVEGEKMSKSKGNFFTVRDLIASEADGGKGIDPLAVRLALISGQYRKPFNFTRKSLADSVRMRERYAEALRRVRSTDNLPDDGDDRLGSRLDDVYDRTLDAMLDDLNTPAALAAALEGAKLIAGLGDNLNRASAQSAIAWFEKTNALLGIIWADEEDADVAPVDPLATIVEERIKERNQARADRDFSRADAIRDELTSLGVELMDSAEGTTWKRRPNL